MTTLLLLAGKSRRFWPLAEKSLWPFLGKPLLSHQIERLRAGGLTEIIAVGGAHNLEHVHDLFPDLRCIEQEDLALGMRGALISALPELKSKSVCIVSANDVVAPSAYAALLRASALAGMDGAILAQRVKSSFPGGYIVPAPGEKGETYPRVAGVVEKPGAGREPSDLVTIVAHVHRDPARLLDLLEDTASDRDDAYEVALTKLCAERRYVAVPTEERWDTVKYPWHILDLTERFLSELGAGEVVGEKCENALRPFGMTQGKLRSGQAPMRKCEVEVHPTAVIEGPVILEEGVRVLPHATILGPCFIGKGSVIGTNTLVWRSIIGEHCVIGFGSEIVRSNLHSHVWTHTTYLGDSVVGRNVAFGAGTVTANFRLDEGEITSNIVEEKVATGSAKIGAMIGDNVRIGINVSLAPGVKLGAGVFVNSACYVDRDIPEKHYVKLQEGKLTLRENEVAAPGVREGFGGGKMH